MTNLGVYIIKSKDREELNNLENLIKMNSTYYLIFSGLSCCWLQQMLFFNNMTFFGHYSLPYMACSSYCIRKRKQIWIDFSKFLARINDDIFLNSGTHATACLILAIRPSIFKFHLVCYEYQTIKLND
jgi:hypothetical protein